MASPHLVFFEPSALWSAARHGPPPDFARDRDVVYAPHIYTGGFDGEPITRAAFASGARRGAALRRRAGARPASGARSRAAPRIPSDRYFPTHQALQDEFRFGATLWTWRESCGDPHKAGDVRAGTRARTCWGEFEVDCTTNTVTGVRQDLVDALTRAYVRAAPGRLETTTWNAHDRRAHRQRRRRPGRRRAPRLLSDHRHPRTSS